MRYKQSHYYIVVIRICISHEEQYSVGKTMLYRASITYITLLKISIIKIEISKESNQ